MIVEQEYKPWEELSQEEQDQVNASLYEEEKKNREMWGIVEATGEWYVK